MSQIQDKPHPQALRQSEIIYTNGTPRPEQKLQWASIREASSRHNSSKLGPSTVAGNGAPARIARHLARNIGVRRSSSAQSASSSEVAGSSWIGRVAAM